MMHPWLSKDINSLTEQGGQGNNSSSSSSPTLLPNNQGPKQWLFRVRIEIKLKKEETVCVVGNISELGSWTPENCVPLQQDENDGEIWYGSVELPAKKKIDYRYCVCTIIELGIQVVIRSWEAHLIPRSIDYSEESPTFQSEPEVYGFGNTSFTGGFVEGYYNEIERIDRGWLNKESIVQLKLCNNPLTLWRSKYVNKPAYIKATPVNLRKNSSNFALSMAEALDESLSDTQDGLEGAKFAVTEVASLNADDPTFQPQDQFGVKLTKDDMIIFQCSILFPQNTAYLIDFYMYSSVAEEEEDLPQHIGFSYLLPTALQSSEGYIILPVTSTKHRPLGELRVEYLVIGSMPNFKCDMTLSYARHWKKTRQGLDVGHRGSGSSFKTKMQNCAEVRENTIASLKNAIDHGADYVEFDVQLSKDLVPIIYHDFHVCISMKKKKTLDDMDMLELPVKELTLEQLRMLKVYHLSEAKTKNQRFFDEDLDDHQPFPTLQQLLETLDPHVGFNIEIKWTMKLADGSYELYHPTDLNLYLDTILEVVLRHGGNRRIVFSCFNPDICAVIRLKQNKYPVVFLTVGESTVYDKYADPRCWSIKAAAQYAQMIEILGINVHTEDLLRDPSLVKQALERNLIIFGWGDDNADPATIKFLKELGLHGVIYDKIHEHNSKEVKESIFLMKSRSSQNELMQLAAAQAEAPQPPKSPPRSEEPPKDGPEYDVIKKHLSETLSNSAQSLESSGSI